MALRACWAAFARLYFGLRVRGRAPGRGGCILAANHTSFLDAGLVGLTTDRRVRFMMTDFYADLPLMAWFFRWNRVIFVREDRGNTAAYRAALAALRDGDVVGIFPEGGISLDGELQAIRAGVVALALRSRAPVVPIGIHGAFEALPRHGKFPKPRTIRIEVGAPLAPGDLVAPGHTDAAGLRAAAARLGREIARLAERAAAG